MATWKDRLLDEQADLGAKLGKLEAFIASREFRALPIEDRELLRLQHRAMREYAEILLRRVNRHGLSPR